MSQQLPPPHSLEYVTAGAPKVARRMLTRRWMLRNLSRLIVCAVVAVAYVSYRKPWIWYGSMEAYRWHLCMTCSVPEGTVAYEDDPARIKVIEAGPDKSRYSMESADPYRRAQYSNSSFREIMYKADFLFMHGRRAGGAPPRLVTVGFRGGRDEYGSDVVLDAMSTPPTANRGARVGEGTDVDLKTTSEHLRLFVGQPDPKDDSHFTIRYEIGDRPGTIDGWLLPDDSVKLQIRDGPATNPSYRKS